MAGQLVARSAERMEKLAVLSRADKKVERLVECSAAMKVDPWAEWWVAAMASLLAAYWDATMDELWVGKKGDSMVEQSVECSAEKMDELVDQWAV